MFSFLSFGPTKVQDVWFRSFMLYIFLDQVPQFLSFQNEVSSVSLEPTANHKTTWWRFQLLYIYIVQNPKHVTFLKNKSECSPVHSVESSQIQCKDSQYSVGLGKDVDSVPLICSMTDYQSVDQNSSEDVRCGLDKESQSTNLNQLNEVSSGISNRTYSPSNSSSSYFFKQPVANIYPSENFLVSSKNLEPMIQTDFQYSVWSGCTDSGISKLIHIMPPKNETAVVLGYQSLDDQDGLISCDDLIIEKPYSIKELQDVPFSVCEGIIMPMDEDYQSF